MKQLNLLVYITEMTTEISKATVEIRAYDDLNQAKIRGGYVVGLIDALVVMSNGLIAEGNNEFTGQMDVLEEKLYYELYDALAHVAYIMQDYDSFGKYADKRDEHKWRDE